MDSLLHALHWRFATKEFSDKKVPEEEIAYLMEATRLAPGSFNIQPWTVIVVQDKKILDKLLPVSYNQPQVKTTNCLFVFCANKDLNEAFDKVESGMKKSGATEDGIRGYVQAVHNLIRRLSEEEQLIFARRQMYIAVGVMLAAASLHKIDAGPMEGLDSDGVARILSLPKTLHPSVNVAIGYRKENPQLSKYRNETSVMFERR